MIQTNLAQVAAYIAKLAPSVGGCKKPMEMGALFLFYRVGNIAEMVSEVKHHFRLGHRLTLAMVNNGGEQGVPAWIEKPANVPLFGTPEFSRMHVRMFLKKDFIASSSFEAVCLAIGHELSHVVIEGIQHPLRQEERAVDLLTMVLGLSDVYAKVANGDHLSGWQTGYLTPGERIFARNMIAHMR